MKRRRASEYLSYARARDAVKLFEEDLKRRPHLTGVSESELFHRDGLVFEVKLSVKLRKEDDESLQEDRGRSYRL